MLARQAHHLALVRSVHHAIGDHNAGAYYALTGRYPVDGGRLIAGRGPTNFPPFGAVLAKLRPTGRPLPDFVHLPDWMRNNGVVLPGQEAGFLGAAVRARSSAGDPSLPGYQVPGLDLPREAARSDRVGRRRALLDAPRPGARRRPRRRPARRRLYRKAFELIAAPRRAGRSTCPTSRRGPRAVRARPRQRPRSRGPQVRRPAPPGPVPAAGPPADRGRRAAGDRLHRPAHTTRRGTPTATTSRS